ncbi:MAG TPA: VOC family protein [Thermoanaerobaculia bacterium]|nr:VOC family protein [Thermoanaerobaculia bacterium]
MSELGKIGWVDLTVPDAERLRDFYREVAGWEPEALSMGEYDDYVMKDAGGGAVAGVCHARGPNAALPPQWLIYIQVADLDASIERCAALGGRVIAGPKGEGQRYCVVEDPAGAVSALIEGKAGG